jgi:hypothetical protein
VEITGQKNSKSIKMFGLQENHEAPRLLFARKNGARLG